jgi:hypothetical protein
MKPMIDILQFASDPGLLNLQLFPKQQQILSEFWAGNFQLAVWALGRRSGKTLMSAVVGCYAACILADQYKQCLRPGERFYIVSVANTESQATIALRNVKDLMRASPILKQLIQWEIATELELSNGASFRAMPASSRGGRGMAAPLVIFDELAHAVDTEGGDAAGSSLYSALSPSVKQFKGLGKILMLSSPWIQQGLFWDKFKQASSGEFSEYQVVNLPTWAVNPNISEADLEIERRANPELFSIEYGANFSKSLSGFLDSALIDMAVNRDRTILPPIPKFRGSYYLSLDPAKGNRDAYTACIGHYDGDVFMVDKFHEFAPSWSEASGKQQVNIAEVESWIIDQGKLYGFSEVVLYQYNSAGTIQRLSSQLRIRELTWTAPSKTEAFSKLKELFNSGNIELYWHQKAIAQLKNLIVKYNSNGSWSVSSGSGAAVDDYPMALAGAVLVASPYAGRISHIPIKSARDFNSMFHGYGNTSINGY